MSRVKPQPCEFCPYRRDVPSGVWGEEEYAKLEAYDGETFEQPVAVFHCHATPEFICHGWACVGGWDLLGMRIAQSMSRTDIEIPEPAVPLFASGREAAEHGRREITRPSPEARGAIARLLKYKRIRDHNKEMT